MDVAAHARYAWVMNFLMEKGGKGEEEAAKFVVEHGGLRRWLGNRSRANLANLWRVVANWRDWINGGSCTELERTFFDASVEIANFDLQSAKDVEREAKKLLRDLKIHFSRD